MPGSVPIIRNVDLARRTVNALFVEGIEPDRIASYCDHYAAVDPWMSLIEATEHGQIRVTERDHPSSTFRNSEFYNDWLKTQNNLKAATGIRIDVDARNAVVICWHYTIEQAERFDRTAATLLDRLKPRLLDAVRSAALLRHGLEQSTRLGPLIERFGGAVLLVDSRRRIREINAVAAAGLAKGEIFSGTGDILVMRDAAAQRWLEEIVTDVLAGTRQGSAAAVFADCDKVFRMSVTRAPDHGGPDFTLLVRPRPYALVIIQTLTGVSLRLDEAALRLAYGLSGAETRLCEALANGHSLVEAAKILGISEGTVRQRVKAVFQKTGTHRQGELIALVSPFAADC